MAAVTRKAFTPGQHKMEQVRQENGDIIISVSAMFEFPSTGETGWVFAQETVTLAQLGTVTGLQILAAAKARIKTVLETYRGQTNTVTEED